MKILLPHNAAHPRNGLTLIADSARRPDRRPLFVSDNGATEARILIGVRISRLGKCIRTEFAPRYYDAFSAMCLVTPAGQTATGCIVADDSLVQGEWTDLPADDTIHLHIDGRDTACPLPRHDIDGMIHHLSADMSFKTGDILILPAALHTFTPIPGTACTVTYGNEKLLEFNIK